MLEILQGALYTCDSESLTGMIPNISPITKGSLPETASCEDP